MISRRAFVTSCILALLAPIPVLAAEQISAPDALAAARAGKLVLVDVRRPSEWRKSGVASVAVALSMHQAGFLQGLEKLRQNNPGKRIALICATGGRTAFLQRELANRGFDDVIDVSEGMFGNGRGPGWLARKLPLRQHDSSAH